MGSDSRLKASSGLAAAPTSSTVTTLGPGTGSLTRRLPPRDRHRRPARARTMRMRGLEPPQSYLHTDLNRARLPIPPHPRWRAADDSARRRPVRSSLDGPRAHARGLSRSGRFASLSAHSPLSSRGLGRRPLTAETRVRIPVAVLGLAPEVGAFFILGPPSELAAAGGRPHACGRGTGLQIAVSQPPQRAISRFRVARDDVRKRPSDPLSMMPYARHQAQNSSRFL